MVRGVRRLFIGNVQPFADLKRLPEPFYRSGSGLWGQIARTFGQTGDELDDAEFAQREEVRQFRVDPCGQVVVEEVRGVGAEVVGQAEDVLEPRVVAGAG